MKAAIIYSGKGGVGKTTTTANIARVLCKKHKVFVLDMDINTPSMNTEFKSEHPEENLWVHSTGNMFDKFIFLENSMIERFIISAQKKIRKVNPDVILIDTPPSITQTHINVLKLITVSVVVFVSQPTELSREDVIRTASFFKGKCDPCIAYLVENMCSETTLQKPTYDYGIDVVAQIPLIKDFKADELITTCYKQYEEIGEKIMLGAEVEQKPTFHKPPYDETFDLVRVYDSGGRNRCLYAVIKRDGDELEKEMLLGKFPKFLSARTWERMQDYVERYERWPRTDMRVELCTAEKIGRMLKPFYEMEQAYFMVVNAPKCEIQLVTGEIGQASLDTTGTSHYGIPRLKYQTSRGSITLFPDEVLPIGIEDLQQFLQEGYKILTDGRYLPPKQTVQMCYNAYGDRVGLSEKWEDIYDNWTKNK
ncbi:MAG: P-loop NTPase [Aeriscardovia sp.]|nr:P-loop NTPase [Aeriscardovia sp.]